jgi:hypothetical protein
VADIMAQFGAEYYPIAEGGITDTSVTYTTRPDLLPETIEKTERSKKK